MPWFLESVKSPLTKIASRVTTPPLLHMLYAAATLSSASGNMEKPYMANEATREVLPLDSTLCRQLGIPPASVPSRVLQRRTSYCGWRKSCTTCIISIFNDLTTHPRTPFLTLTTVLSEAVQDFRHWNKFASGGFQCQC